jgi:transposase
LIESVNQEIKAVEKELESLTQEDPEFREKKEILSSIPSIGKHTAIVLLGLMPELGRLDRNSACSLAGLAPMNFDSGKMKGKRHIQKGRHDIRRHLYMPILGAVTRHNPVLKSFYQRLIQAGKPAKVALTACMRKLLVIANGMLSRKEHWKVA